MVLHAQRSVGFAPNPISLADATAYLRACGYEGDDGLEMLDLVLSLDSEWLTWSRERSSDGNGSVTTARD